MFDCRYWLWLSSKFEPGATKCDKLLRAFNYDPKAIYEAEREAYEPICASNPRLLNALCDKSLGKVCEILEYCEKNNVGILTMDDEKYPSSLLRIEGQPPVIYYKGTIPDFETRFSISIVGTRSASAYGTSAAYTIAHDLASAGSIVVSGMALGSDTAAHRGALDAKGTTVAFLGCGINVVYPKENQAIMEEIIASGAVMTDYPPFARPEGRHFPVRNRLISGVSHGVLVVEAAKKSGALITAQHALKQGKLLYAIPGRIGELNSEGTNNLLIEGAKTVTRAEDIMTDFRLIYGLSEKVNVSGFTQYRLGNRPPSDLSQPYKTPTYNPFTTSKGGFSDINAKPSFFEEFSPYPKKKVEKEEKYMTSEPKRRYYDLNREEPSGKGASGFEKPKPIIVFGDFDDEEHLKANSALTEKEKQELEQIELLTHRPIIRYPKGPIPMGGYKTKITKEKAEYYDRLESGSYPINSAARNTPKVKSTVPIEADFKSLDEMYEYDKRRHEQMLKSKAQAKEKGELDTSGLTSVEISVMKLLDGGKRLTVDSMSHLGIPLPKLLSVLTLLEIKRRITQLPGGYFEINKDF